ncbi:Small subunit (SSU) processome component [Sporothrix stenoceras]|uniref:Small subunit (SSU) processome component n=1 Tax=Sporothrix stenoceras TaxID=5173 RepID=A0ABR3YZD8_9PEZI
MSSTKRKAPPVRIAQPQTTRNAKPMAKARINESKTSVVSVPKHQQKSAKKSSKTAGEAIEISSDESDNDEDVDEDDLMDEDEPESAAAEEPKTNGHASTNGTTSKEDADNSESNDDDDEDHEPTFGDLVREHETVDVTAALSQQNPAEANTDAAATNGAAAAGKSAVAAPTLASLGHLLNAALRSGDDANLEVCFNTTTDAVWVRNTIQRLDPSLAGTLLQKLAARIHRRPGRAHTLVGWVQWTLITHGGALLANQAGVTRALQELHRVLEERARGLNSLLLLKGKLDMLEAQMQLRRLQRAGTSTGNFNTPGGGHSGVATVGGRSSNSKALETINTLTSRRGAASRRRNGLAGRGARGGEDDDEFVATYREEDDVEDEDVTGQILVNGAGLAGESFIADSDEEALDEDDDDDSEGDEDDDAEDDDDLEEMDEDDAAEEDEIDFDDVDDEDDDDDEDDEDDAAAAPPPKLQKKSGGAFSKRR